MRHAYIVYLALCLVGLGTRTTYEILKQRGKVDTGNANIFAVVFVGMILMLASWILMCPVDPWRIFYPGVVRGIGLAALIVGFGLAIAGIIQLRGLEDIDHLVTNGLFAKMRHPMYTGFIFWILGWVIYYGAFLSLIIGIVCIGNILYWRRLEESKLVAIYGDTYLKYSKRTWF